MQGDLFTDGEAPATEGRERPETVFTTVKRYFLTEQRDKKRVWLEGAPLERAGFSPQTRYRQVYEPDEGRLILEVDPEGSHNVVGKETRGKRTPVVDINNKRLDELFENASSIEVIYEAERIVIQRSALDKRIQAREEALRTTLLEGAPLRTGSLYHGTGVLDRGLHEGFGSAGQPAELVLAVEMVEDYLENSKRVNPMWAPRGAMALCAPMELCFLDDSYLPEVSLLSMGIPCTGASRAGMSKNGLEIPEEHASAGAQFIYALKAIDRLNPAMVLVENVPEYEKSAGWISMKSVLKTMGYEVDTRVLAGRDFGALEDRKRMVAIGVSRGVAKELSFDLASVRGDHAPPERLADILDPMDPSATEWKQLDHLVAKEQRDAEAGKGFRLQWLDPEEADRIGTIGKGYAKIRSTEPMVRHPTDPTLVRLLTPQEHARAKGIPTDMVAGVSSLTLAHEMLGQSVVFPVFERLGHAIGTSCERARVAFIEEALEKAPLIQESIAREYSERAGGNPEGLSALEVTRGVAQARYGAGVTAVHLAGVVRQHEAMVMATALTNNNRPAERSVGRGEGR